MRRSPAACAAGACGIGFSPLPSKRSHQTTIPSSTTKTVSPTHVWIFDPMTISAPYAIVRTRNRNADSSVLNGLFMSEDVHRDVDDDPHHVDEVPVDPAHLDSVMMLGTEVPPKRT